MKKVLSILASFGLVATSAMVVISCKVENVNNLNVEFKDVQKWFNDAQPKERPSSQDDMTPTKLEGKTMIIAIGGRKNSDTLSYLATLNMLVNKREFDAKKLLEQENVKTIENKLSDYQGRSTGIGDKSWQSTMNGMIYAVSDPTNNWDEDKNQVSKIAKDYFHHDVNNNINQIEFHTILTDKIENFWNEEVGKGIVETILMNQLKEFLDFAIINKNLPTGADKELEETVNNPDKYKKFIEKKTKKMVDEFQKNQKETGPWFLVVRSGKIIGIKTGFRNFYEFNKEYTKDDNNDKNSLQKGGLELANQTFKEFGQEIIKAISNGVDWLENNFLTNEEGVNASQLISKNNPSGQENSATWNSKTSGTSNIEDLNDPRGDKDAKDEEDDKDKDDEGKDKPTDPDDGEKSDEDNEQPETMSFKSVNLNKYL